MTNEKGYAVSDRLALRWRSLLQEHCTHLSETDIQESWARLLRQPQIYYSDFFQEKFEQQARVNIQSVLKP